MLVAALFSRMVVACCTCWSTSPERIIVSAFLLIIYRSLEIKHSFKLWLNDNSWCEIFVDFSKTAKKQEKMRHRFQDSFDVNILNRKMNRKINSIRAWGFGKAEFQGKITSFLPPKFEYADYIFPIPSILFNFCDPEEC